MDRDEMLKGMDVRYSLFGTFFAFGNRLQAAGDVFYDEITCKQFFLIICLGLFQGNAPTIKELAEVMGSSHQNVKQLADKLERNGYIRIFQDEADKRKIRIAITEKIEVLGEKYSAKTLEFFGKFYSGTTEEELLATFRTLSKLEENLIIMKEEYQ